MEIGKQSDPIQPKSDKQPKYYDPNDEYLLFDDSIIRLHVNHLRPIHLEGGVVVRHYKKNSTHKNCYQNKDAYLRCIFKELLTRGRLEKISYSSMQRQSIGTNRTCVLAQFHSFNEVVKTGIVEDLPTYVISFEIEMINDGSDKIIRISFRQVTRQSFLSNVLDSFCHQITDQTSRACLIVEFQGQDSNDQFKLRPCRMSVSPREKMIDKRLFLVAKHGWLSVFVQNSPEMYLLLENEYLIFPSQLQEVPIFYERVLEMNQINMECSEMFYRRTSINHDQFTCNGMIVARGVMQNEFKPDTFTLIGYGNAIINLTYIQQLLTISADDKNKTHRSNK